MLQVRVLPGLSADSSRISGQPAQKASEAGGEMNRIVQFFRESYAELRKVTWPSREEVGNSTKIVLISVSLIAVALGLVDFVFFQAIDLIF